MSTPSQPYINQVYLNRIFLLQIFNHYDLTNTANELIINILATGGQNRTDISITESEAQLETPRAQVLADGCYKLYGIEFGPANNVRSMPRLGEMADVYAGLQITDCLGNGCEQTDGIIMEGWNVYWEKWPTVLGFDWKYGVKGCYY